MNRKRRVRRRLAQVQKKITKTAPGEVQELRQRRARRYQKRRAALKASQLKPRKTLTQVERRSLRTQATAVVGQTQRKRVRHQPEKHRKAAPTQRRETVQVRRTRASQTPYRRVRLRRKRTASLQFMKLLVSGVGVALVAGAGISLMHPEPPVGEKSNPSALQFQESAVPRTTSVAPPALPYEKRG